MKKLPQFTMELNFTPRLQLLAKCQNVSRLTLQNLDSDFLLQLIDRGLEVWKQENKELLNEQLQMRELQQAEMKNKLTKND